MMKLIKWLLIVVVVLVAAVTVTLIVWGGGVIKQSVNSIGPQVLGVPVKLEDARFQPLRGQVHLTGLFVGNPEGFNTDSLFEMQTLQIDLDVKSLLSDTIVINRILIDSPQITYEIGLRKTNLGVVLENLEGEPSEDEPKPDREKDDAPGKSVLIKELILADARAQVSAPAMGGHAVPIQLSTITLTNLGGEDQSTTEIVAEVIKAILGAVVNGVAGAGDLLGDGLKSALDGVGALGGMATDGVRSAAGMVGDGAGAVSDSIGAGAQRVRDMFPGGTNESAPDAEDLPILPEVTAPDVSEQTDKAVEKVDEATKKIEGRAREGAARLSGALGGLRGGEGETEE